VSAKRCRCPWCRHEVSDSPDFDFQPGRTVAVCANCGKPVAVTCLVSIRYLVAKVEASR